MNFPDELWVDIKRYAIKRPWELKQHPIDQMLKICTKRNYYITGDVMFGDVCVLFTCRCGDPRLWVKFGIFAIYCDTLCGCNYNMCKQTKRI